MFTENYQLYVPESAQVGKAVGKIKANDEDLGINAEIAYSITNSEGAAIFSITSDRDKREGVISLKKVGDISPSPTRIIVLCKIHSFRVLLTIKE